MPTIPGLPDATLPLSGADRIPIHQLDGVTRDSTLADVAALAALYASNDLGARPERLDALGTHFTTQGAGLQLDSWFPPAITMAAAYGPVFQATGAGAVWTRGMVSAGHDKVLEVEAEIEQVSVGGGEAPRFRVGLRSLSASHANVDASPDAWSPLSQPMTAGRVLTVRHRFGGIDRTEVDQWADAAAAVWLRPMVEFNRKGDLTGYEPASVARVRRLLVRDVTALVEAENWLMISS